VLSGHGDAVVSAAYSPDSTRIVTASDDKTARIWDARTGAQLAVLSGHGARVNSAAYSPEGTHIVTASDDKTARIWDARIPATIAAQILWDAAAEADPLPEVDRTELGLRSDARVRQWGTEGSACDQAAAAFYDPDRLARGLVQAAIVADVANSACSTQIAPIGSTPRLAYQAARALLAKFDVKGARQQFELAVSAGYRAAQVDLANLLVDASAGMLDPERAAALDQKHGKTGYRSLHSHWGIFTRSVFQDSQISQRLGLGIRKGRTQANPMRSHVSPNARKGAPATRQTLRGAMQSSSRASGSTPPRPIEHAMRIGRMTPGDSGAIGAPRWPDSSPPRE
jgi:hypothetical protein